MKLSLCLEMILDYYRITLCSQRTLYTVWAELQIQPKRWSALNQLFTVNLYGIKSFSISPECKFNIAENTEESFKK